MFLFIKNISIILCYILSGVGLNKQKCSSYVITMSVLYSGLLSFVISLISIKYIYFSVVIVFASTTIFMSLACKINEIFINIISLTIAYVSYYITSIIVSFLVFPLSENIQLNVGFILKILLQLIMVYKFIKNKRIVSGINQLTQSENAFMIVLICISILVSSSILSSDIKDIILIMVFVVLFVLSVLMFVYWNRVVTKHYLERLSLRNIDMLNKELEEKNAYIEKLLEDKNRIEKLNHKNYKLVPAMQGAVMHYLNGVKSYMESSLDDPALAEMAVTSEGTFVKNKLSNFIEEGNKLIEELNKMNSEWTEYVNNDNLNGDSDVPSCGVPRVDYILSYMHERSLKEDFILKINVEQSLEKLTEKIISEEDLATLLADLIDNAIIATKYNNGKQILVRLGMMGKDYTVEVYDSGVPFDKEVLVKYGREQITTHADDSGSGIGMMQTFEILSKCGAGLFVDEYKQGEGVYTKRISVVFNRKHQYVLYTCRSDEDIAYLKKRSDLMVIKK